MRFIGIIPVRMESSRFPGKPLASIAGRPMLRHVWDAVAAAKSIMPYYVATDSPEIAAYCERERMGCIMTERSCRNGTERCHDAMRSLAMRDRNDVVINIQGDEPLISPGDLDALCQAFSDKDVRVASLYYRPAARDILLRRGPVKVLLGMHGDALAFSREPVSPGLCDLYGVHVGVYGYRRDLLKELVKMTPIGDLEQLVWMREKINMMMVDIGHATQPVDYPEDVAAVEAALAEGGK